jgi:hypothetical protein
MPTVPQLETRVSPALNCDPMSRLSRAGRTAARGRQGETEASAVRTGSSARGRRARAGERAQPERCGLTKQPDARWRRRWVAGAQGNQPASSLLGDSATRNSSNSDVGTQAGPQGTSPAEPCAPTWHSWNLRAATWGVGRVRAWGYLSARPSYSQSSGADKGRPLL